MKLGSKSFNTMSPSQRLAWHVKLATAGAMNKIHAHLAHQDQQESPVSLVKMVQMAARVNLDHQLLHTQRFNHQDHADSAHLETKVHLAHLVNLAHLVPKVLLVPRDRMVNPAFHQYQHHKVSQVQQVHLVIRDQRETMERILMLVAKDQMDRLGQMVNLDHLDHQPDLVQLANPETKEDLVHLDRLDNLADLEAEVNPAALETRAILVQMPSTVLAHEEAQHKPSDQQNQNGTLDYPILWPIIGLTILDFQLKFKSYCLQ